MIILFVRPPHSSISLSSLFLLEWCYICLEQKNNIITIDSHLSYTIGQVHATLSCVSETKRKQIIGSMMFKVSVIWLLKSTIMKTHLVVAFNSLKGWFLLSSLFYNNEVEPKLNKILDLVSETVTVILVLVAPICFHQTSSWVDWCCRWQFSEKPCIGLGWWRLGHQQQLCRKWSSCWQWLCRKWSSIRTWLCQRLQGLT